MDIGIQKITPNFWFNTNAEDAVNFYVSIFKDASIGRTIRYSGEGKEIHGMEKGTVMTIEFQLEGQRYLALNGGDEFEFNESISFIVNCDSQEEVDYYWDKLTEGGDESAQVCGWLKDKFGVSWQVVPRELDDMMVGGDRERVNRIMRSLLQMKKLDLNELRKAYVGE
ncbi:VOC family protein [Planococcus salinarum]|uniref:VOC family protein n=1 Tax=Planococcus salinarum TaxID=622695 RepID=UPI000E3B56C6|nr:VOC family protein [Planococcus salinarum]TAA69737.1 VOC family protein [Planococcus salinarum]